MSDSRLVGMFDSGVGGLSVLSEFHALRPTESIVYFADTAWCPYGVRPHDEIRGRSIAIASHLVDLGAKAVVVACNTASAVAIDDLRAALPDTPFIGLEPAVKPAAAMSRTKSIGVLATPRTATGERLKWLIETHGNDVTVHTVAATGLVELVEQGVLEGPEVVAALEPLLDPMMAAGVDVVVLGCTHYPYLKSAISAYVGPDVQVIDSGSAIARRTQSILDVAGLLSPSFDPGSLTLLTSGDGEEVSAVASMLLGQAVQVTHAEPGTIDSTPALDHQTN